MFFLRVPDAKFLVQTSCIDSRNRFFNWKYKSKKYFAMAEGGHFNEANDPDDPDIPGNDDDDNEDEQDPSDTTHFWPRSAFTPGPSGE